MSGMSRQAHAQWRKRQEHRRAVEQQIVGLMEQIRQRHPRMSCKRMYRMVQDQVPVGRDQFEQIGFGYGYRVKRKRSPWKTTWSQRAGVFPNLIEGLEINSINQVWQSDIFYLKVEGVHYYGVTIEDLYSRRLLALHFSRSLAAEETVRALQQALKVRAWQVKGCIFHSDRGSQYLSAAQQELLKEAGLRISMCKWPQENAYVERIQGVLQQEYLLEHRLSRVSLKRYSQQVQRYYNQERPHSRLGYFTPVAFEEWVLQQAKPQRPVLKVYAGFEEKA